jgi:predicted membrane channel-forming protein YqfA (hemolysin III family)
MDSHLATLLAWTLAGLLVGASMLSILSFVASEIPARSEMWTILFSTAALGAGLELIFDQGDRVTVAALFLVAAALLVSVAHIRQQDRRSAIWRQAHASTWLD